MLIKRQLPILFARGSIFNVTAKNLSECEKTILESLIDQVRSELYDDRRKFIYRLSATIGADYKDDVSDGGPADMEFSFAIWKASLHLLHHCDYTYQCNNCQATSYRNTSGRTSKFDQKKPFCPVCDCCEISDPRQSGLKRGAFITHETLLLLVDQLASDGLEPPKTQSCIRLIKGSKKNIDPDIVLNDANQRKRFFSKVVWNYFRQVIKENKIQKQFRDTEITGCSDVIAVDCLTAYLRKNGIKHSHNPAEPPVNGYRFIECDLYSLALRYIPELAEITKTIREWGVTIEFTYTGIKVFDQRSDAKIVTAAIKSRDYVIMETSVATQDGDKQDDKIESLEDQMNGVAEFEQTESMTAIRDALSDDAKKIFDIYAQAGEHYTSFEEKYGSNKPRKADIAQFLGTNQKNVNDKVAEIRAHWMRLNPIES